MTPFKSERQRKAAMAKQRKTPAPPKRMGRLFTKQRKATAHAKRVDGVVSRLKYPGGRESGLWEVRPHKSGGWLKVKRLSPTEFDLTTPGYDWHLHREGKKWILDQFDASIKDPNRAHIRSIEVESKRDGIGYAREEPPRGGGRRAV